MFFRMIKNSLKRKKLMNLTLFLFIFISTVIVCSCTSAIYYATIGLRDTFERTHTADFTIIAKQPMRDYEKIDRDIANWAKHSDDMTAYHQEEIIELNYKQVDFIGVNEEDHTAFISTEHYLSGLPKGHNQVYDLEDQPFSLKHGEIAIGSGWQSVTNTKIGDEIQLTTDMGNTYSFKVAHFFKDILFPMDSLYNSKRYFISDQDFAQLLNETPIPTKCYTFEASDSKQLIPEFKAYSDCYQLITKEEIWYSYIAQKVIAFILICYSGKALSR